jgi:signal peptidase II
MKLGKTAIILMTLFGSVGCDQVTKYAAREMLTPRETHSYLGDIFRVTLVENHGAFLGLGSNLPESVRTIIFTVVVGIALVAALIWMIRNRALSTTAIVATSLVVGGGIGNLIDRVASQGGVTDFLNLGIGALRTGIFNVADVWIMAGAALLFLAKDFRNSDEPEEPTAEATEKLPDV